MSEQLNQEVIPENQPAAQETPELSPIEQKAMEMGWKPKEQFAGNEEDFVDAKEFVRRQPLFDKISQQSREIKEVRKALEAFKNHYTTVQETAYKQALNDLKKARREALTEGDGDRFEQLDDEIKSVEKQVEAIKEAAAAPVAPELPQEFVSWQNQNRWYTEVGYMRQWADDYGISLAKSGLSPSEVLKKVSEGVRKEFPHKFTNPNKAAAPAVSENKPSGGSTPKGLAAVEASLSETDRKAMETFVRNGLLTKEQYLKDFQAASKQRN